jgi:hypothetical protein
MASSPLEVSGCEMQLRVLGQIGVKGATGSVQFGLPERPKVVLEGLLQSTWKDQMRMASTVPIVEESSTSAK